MEFIEIGLFAKVADQLLTQEEFQTLQNELITNPDSGVIVPGCGGARKIRVKFGSKGKSGGGRAIYYFKNSRNQIWFLMLYSKKWQSNLDTEERELLKGLILKIKSY